MTFIGYEFIPIGPYTFCVFDEIGDSTHEPLTTVKNWEHSSVAEYLPGIYNISVSVQTKQESKQQMPTGAHRCLVGARLWGFYFLKKLWGF